MVIPCYRSGATLPELVRRLGAALPTAVDAYEIILVVDGSPDDTPAVASELQAADPEHVRVVLLRRNYGQHNALLAGIARASNEVIVTMDDDLQHRPETIAELIAPLEDPLVDLVYGVAAQEEHGFWRSLASRTLKASLAMVKIPSANDVSAFRAFRAELRDGFAHVNDPYTSIDVLLSWTTTAVRRVTVSMDMRTTGTSGYTFPTLMRTAWNMVIGYGVAPLRLVTYLGLATSFVGFVLLVVTLVRYVRGEIEVAGFTTLASMLALIAGVLMLGLGVLGEYMGRLTIRSMERPAYVVRADSLTRPLPGRPASRSLPAATGADAPAPTPRRVLPDESPVRD